MQLLSSGWPLAELRDIGFERLLELFRDPELRHVGVVIASLFVISHVLAVLAYWLSSKALAPKDDATLRNGFVLWLCYIGLALVWSLVLVLTLACIAPFETTRIMIVGGGMLLLGVLLVVVVPMRLYRLGFWRALGFLLLSLVIQIGAISVVQIVAMHTPFTGRYPKVMRQFADQNFENQRRLADLLRGKGMPDEIDRLLDQALDPTAPRRTLAEQERAVTVLQRKLDERQRALPPNDQDAAAKFQRQLDRYMKLLNEVKADRTTATPPVTSPAPP